MLSIADINRLRTSSKQSKTLVRCPSKTTTTATSNNTHNATIKKTKQNITPHKHYPHLLSCFTTSSKQLTLKTRPRNQNCHSNNSTFKKGHYSSSDPPSNMFDRSTSTLTQSQTTSLRSEHSASSSFLDAIQEQTDKPRQWKKEDFEFIKRLGRGKFGEVFSAREKQSNYIVAIKQMKKVELEQHNFVEQVKKEIQIQAYLKHQNILRLFGFFWDADSVYLILEYAPGCELYKEIKLYKQLPEPRASNIVGQVIRGALYLHSKGIIHRDIKPQNLLVSFDKIKIADFGWSVFCEQERRGDEDAKKKRDTLCGTLDYLAPEMIKGLKYDESVDVWAIGILSYELVVGSPPFETSTYEETYEKICFEGVKYPSWMSKDLVNFLKGILVKDPARRLTLEEALQHPWIREHSHAGLSS